jgi:3-hydroxy-5-methyl-1-naphthoate 3-O-methyltransferase
MTTPQTPTVSPERILRTQWDYAPPLILAAAVRLKIFDHLAEGPRSVAEVTERAGASERGVRSLLNGLAGLRFLAKEPGERYRLTPESEAFLVSSKPGYLGGMFGHARDLIRQWLDLADVVRTGKPLGSLTEEGGGASFFSELVVSLYPMNLPMTQALGRILGVAERREPMQILDIAAGSGVWGIGVGQQSPQATVTAVDWPQVLEVTHRFAAEAGMADRFSYIDGDAAEVDFGGGFQLAILGHILHSEGERRSRALLRKTFAALAPGGTIAIAEFLVDADRSEPPMGVIFGLNMLLHTDEGDTFSFEEISSWLRDAGFVEPRRVDPGGPASLILAQKPSA